VKQEELDRIMLALERADYLILSLFLMLENQKYQEVAVGVVMLKDHVASIRKMLEVISEQK